MCSSSSPSSAASRRSSRVPAAPNSSPSATARPLSSLAGRSRKPPAPPGRPELRADRDPGALEPVRRAPERDPVHGDPARLGDEVHARVGQDLLGERRAAAQVPAHRPVALDVPGEVVGRGPPAQLEVRLSGVRAQDSACRLGRPRHRVAFFQDAPAVSAYRRWHETGSPIRNVHRASRTGRGARPPSARRGRGAPARPRLRAVPRQPPARRARHDLDHGAVAQPGRPRRVGAEDQGQPAGRGGPGARGALGDDRARAARRQGSRRRGAGGLQRRGALHDRAAHRHRGLRREVRLRRARRGALLPPRTWRPSRPG